MLTAEPDDAEPCPVLEMAFCEALTAELLASALPDVEPVDDEALAVAPDDPPALGGPDCPVAAQAEDPDEDETADAELFVDVAPELDPELPFARIEAELELPAAPVPAADVVDDPDIEDLVVVVDPVADVDVAEFWLPAVDAVVVAPPHPDRDGSVAGLDVADRAAAAAALITPGAKFVVSVPDAVPPEVLT